MGREIVMMDTQSLADELRDIMNWVAVFEHEYDLPAEVVEKLHSRLERIAQHLGT